MSQTTPLRDVLDIPTHVAAADFVLQLHAGVEAADRTLGEYIVTDAIAKSFDSALGLVGSAVNSGAPKGAFVHGSFGSGKSHFMAVLHLLLTGNATARALPRLQEVVAKHEATLTKRYLAVDYHLLGKKSLEEALFGGYLAEVKRRHPDKALPVLHKSDSLLADARGLRADFGDGAFFTRLNEGVAAPAGGGFGSRVAAGGAWTPESFDAAAAAGPTDKQRLALVSKLRETFFTASVDSGEWLEISDGLQAMTDHTRSLGYDGLVLFLDELVLWLAQRLADPTFIATEVGKVSKLVETESASLAVPIISFVARQRDLKDFIGDAGVGAEKQGIAQNFGFFEGRFDSITLAAADLPKIVHQRILQPTSEHAAGELRSALGQIKANRAAWSALLTDDANADERAFELVYPFSPALIDALVALSSLLQRERTALKVLSELLCRGRDELVVTDVIPVGDLFDIVVLEQKALASEMEQRFEVARRFYRDRLRPHLLAEHGLTEEAAADLPRTHPFRNHDRLAKTLLVAEIVPEASSLKNLTAGRLAALNFGSVRAMLPGQEATQVLQMVKGWSSHFGEIRVGTGQDPIITLTLSGVDYESVVERVAAEDKAETRRRLIRDILGTALDLPAQEGLLTDRLYHHVWRGSRRDVEVMFANVRDSNVRDDQLRANAGRWKLVIDYPFDEADFFPSDDFARLDRLKSEGLESDTVAWIPYFFTAERMNAVGRLVLLEYLLTGDRFDQNADHLAVLERPQARRTLETQRESLRADLGEALLQAYGIHAPRESDVDAGKSEHRIFATLRAGLQISKPNAATLREGLAKVLDEAYADQYPMHPRFEPSASEVKRSEVTTVLAAVRQAISTPAGRLDALDRPRAQVLRRVTMPLGLGEAHENVFAISQATFRWWGEITQSVATAAAVNGAIRVGDIRSGLSGFGMARDVEDLLILTWAALDDREYRRHGGRLPEPAIGALPDDVEMSSPTLPDEGEWAAAVARAASLFGISGEHRRSAPAVQRLAAKIRETARGFAAPNEQLVDALLRHGPELGIDVAGANARLQTAERGRDLIVVLSSHGDDTDLLVALARADVPTEVQPLAKSMASAGEVAKAISGVRWDQVRAATKLLGGGEILDRVHGAARAEELHAPLAPALLAAGADADSLVLAELEQVRREREERERLEHERLERERLENERLERERLAREAEERHRREQGGSGESHRPITDPDHVDLVVEGAGSVDIDRVRRGVAQFAQDHPGKTIRVTWSVVE
ncbi:hypothetical protein HP550_14495 [Cellulomonas humilata]|uniref:Phage resistance protein n=1 Tax=Cellulomonas humilata TaxID=144055 RepID=A0A7Y6A2A5_9CELL|nr:hypothetical protein [Cellulomonas humilata]NUU18463.1 hypothetical protein [Cellulomonas humilata]